MESQNQRMAQNNSAKTHTYDKGDFNLVRGSEELQAEASIKATEVEDPGAIEEVKDADYCLVQGCEDTGADMALE